MPRHRIKPLGTRSYLNYTPQILEECLEAVRSGELTQRAAELKYGISRSTIKNKLKGKHNKKVGRSRIFTEQEELAFEQHLIKLCEYNFPVVELDFRFAIKCYLDKKGICIDRFKQNLPGYEWTKAFLNRHKELSVRMSKNIKKARAEVGAEDIENYINNLEETLKDVPSSNIWNYDETNLSDDPGSKKVICKRGSKYVEKICNHSKSSTSLMFCGNAEGTVLPPYVVYRAENMWSTWTMNSPEGARYNRSKNGWFDAICFEDWFVSILLPAVKNQNGPKVIIGDNLSSHKSLHVLRLCEQYSVRFVCLPPNSTHLTQPLDVAFFGPMKKLWRGILTKWKESKSGSKFTTIPKDMFPTLLKELIGCLKENQEQNLKKGFEKCGIWPCNKNKLLERLPSSNRDVDKYVIGDSFLEQLEKKRAEFLTEDVSKKKKKKIQVPAGMSITVQDVEEALAKSDVNKPTSRKSIKKSTTLKKKRKISTSSEDNDDIEMILQDSDDGISETFSDVEEILKENTEKTPQPSPTTQMKPEDFVIDSFVIVKYNGQKYPGKIVSVADNGPTVECMENRLKFWRWPEEVDCMTYDWDDICCKIEPPKIASKRNQFFIPELDIYCSS